jgi:hypothetical protein
MAETWARIKVNQRRKSRYWQEGQWRTAQDVKLIPDK